METVNLTAPGIACHHCRATIEREIGALPGVQSVSVDVPTKNINVSYDPAATSRDVIIDRLDEEGYSVDG